MPTDGALAAVGAGMQATTAESFGRSLGIETVRLAHARGLRQERIAMAVGRPRSAIERCLKITKKDDPWMLDVGVLLTEIYRLISWMYSGSRMLWGSRKSVSKRSLVYREQVSTGF